MMSSNTGKAVCVTGGSGFIGSWLVKLLLLRGYTVKATVLNTNDPKEVDHLLKFEGAKERLQLFNANLMEEGSFDSAVEGCEGVFHLASPCFLDAQDPQTQIIDPAVKETINVLKSCAKSSSLKRVVLTSSIVALIFNGKPITPEDIVDETWFSNPDICKEAKMWYPLSKTLAEEAAWKFAKENNIDLVTINPGMVIGPLLQPTLNFSAALIFNLINGAKTFPNRIYGWVNVKDIANAHIQAFEIPSANGRYLITESVAHFSEIVKNVTSLIPNFTTSTKFWFLTSCKKGSFNTGECCFLLYRGVTEIALKNNINKRDSILISKLNDFPTFSYLYLNVITQMVNN